MRTQVFFYNGFLGINSDVKAEGLINDPAGDGQLGFIVDAAFCDISPEAIDFLKKIPKSADDFGDVDCFKIDDGRVLCSWLGSSMQAISSDADATGSREYNPSLLIPNPKVVIPDDFKTFVDEHLKNTRNIQKSTFFKVIPELRIGESEMVPLFLCPRILGCLR